MGINNNVVVSDGGLTQRQKDWATELMIRVTQGHATLSDIQTLSHMREKDEFGFVDSLLDSALMHPDFNGDGAAVDNIHKNALLRIKIIDTKSKVAKNSVETNIADINYLNRLRSFGKASDGSKFGEKIRSEIIVDKDEKPEYDGSGVRVD